MAHEPGGVDGAAVVTAGAARGPIHAGSVRARGSRPCHPGASVVRMSASGPNKTPVRADVDGLRAVAIVLVVAFHVGLAGFSGGFIGVDVFFVISGFLITRNLVAESEGRGRPALLRFWARRVRRLVPALGLMLVVVLGLALVVLPFVEWQTVASQARAAALYVSNLAFARQSTDYFAPNIETSLFLHTWSLGVEEQFYLLWPVLVLAVCMLGRGRPGPRRAALLAVFGATFVCSLALCIVQTAHGSPYAFFGLPARAWEFAAAGLLALAPVPDSWRDGIAALGLGRARPRRAGGGHRHLQPGLHLPRLPGPAPRVRRPVDHPRRDGGSIDPDPTAVGGNDQPGERPARPGAAAVVGSGVLLLVPVALALHPPGRGVGGPRLADGSRRRRAGGAGRGRRWPTSWSRTRRGSIPAWLARARLTYAMGGAITAAVLLVTIGLDGAATAAATGGTVGPAHLGGGIVLGVRLRPPDPIPRRHRLLRGRGPPQPPHPPAGGRLARPALGARLRPSGATGGHPPGRALAERLSGRTDPR